MKYNVHALEIVRVMWPRIEAGDPLKAILELAKVEHDPNTMFAQVTTR